MILIPANILALPFVLAAMAIDAYLLLMAVRVIAGRAQPDGSLARALDPITSWLPTIVNRLMPESWRHPLPNWKHWAIAVAVLLVARHAALAIALAASQPLAQGATP